MTIFLDQDGILSGFVRGVLLKWGVKEDPYLKEENKGCWHIQKILGIPNKEFYQKLDYDFWAEMPLEDDAKEIYSLAAKKVGVENVEVLTTPCHSRGCYAGKYSWMTKHFPKIAPRMNLTQSKFLLAAEDRILIDDKPENVMEWCEAGGKGFLYPRPWNSRHKECGNALNLLEEFLINV